MSTKTFSGMPDFLIIGAGKSGTTSLDKFLGQHPQIFIPVKKEPNFFGYENMKVEDFNGNKEEIKHFTQSITTVEKYLESFQGATPGQIRGETSNAYMYHPQAPYRIKHHIPDVKLMAILRQPAERLYSRYLHLARENRLPSPDFKDCFDRNSIWWQRNDLVKEGFYYTNLLKYYELFPEDQIRIYLYEDLQQSPRKVLTEIFTFLEVDPDFTPDLSLRYNESGFIKNKFLNKIYGQGGLISKSIDAIFPKTVVQKIKSNLSLKRKIQQLRGKNLAKPRMDAEIKQRLTHEVYAEDIRHLQGLINRDLGHWLKT